MKQHVHPNFSDNIAYLLTKTAEKLSGAFMHTGTLSADRLQGKGAILFIMYQDLKLFPEYVSNTPKREIDEYFHRNHTQDV